jgi:hypothetical protein
VRRRTEDGFRVGEWENSIGGSKLPWLKKAPCRGDLTTDAICRNRSSSQQGARGIIARKEEGRGVTLTEIECELGIIFPDREVEDIVFHDLLS